MRILSQTVRYPGPGSIVEFLHGNKPLAAWVLEEQSGKLRLLTRHKREMKLPSSRLLPWSGPQYPAEASRQEIQEALDLHDERRETVAREAAPLELWALAQGEMSVASVQWLAELLWDKPEPDQLAGLGRALIESKTHFRFQPPDFEIFPQDKVESRIREMETTRARERLMESGTRLFQELWALRQGRIKDLQVQIDDELRTRLRELLFKCLAEPEAHAIPTGRPAVPWSASICAESGSSSR